MVDATVTATRVLSDLTQGGTNTLRYCQVRSGAAGTGPIGPGIERQKNAVPALLLREILTAAMEYNTDPQRVYVLDLFAGYGSMRAATKELGLSYVGVCLLFMSCFYYQFILY